MIVIENEMNKADIDEVKTNVLMQHYLRLGGPVSPPDALLTLQRPK